MSPLRQLTVLLVIAAVAGAGWYLRPGEGEALKTAPRRAVTVQVADVRQDTVRTVVEAVGSTRAADSVAVTAKVSGRVTELNVEAGRDVAAGDVLARLDSAAEEAAVAEARALLTDAESKYARARQLQATRAVSAAALDEALATREAAKARLQSAEAGLADRTLRAPFAGVLGLRAISVGTQLEPGTAITMLDALDDLELEFTVPERFFPQLKPGQSVEARAAAFPGRTFPGTVEGIDSRVEPVSRNLRVRARLPNPDRELPAGLFMTATLVLSEQPGLLVPEQAVVLETGRSFVYRVKDGKAERVPVVLGERRPGFVTITEGVAAGESVATSGLQRLRDGASVEIEGAEPPASPAERSDAAPQQAAGDGNRPGRS